jgi:hypothetical protein
MKTATREKPILFSGEMVKAILDGRKSQTRRIVKPQPGNRQYIFGPLNVSMASHSFWLADETEDPLDGVNIKCPYGKPSSILWVRETHAIVADLNASHQDSTWEARVKYKADGESQSISAMNEDWRESYSPPGNGYRSPIHMPKWASRITLEVTEVRVERLQEISGTSLILEGVLPADQWTMPTVAAEPESSLHGDYSRAALECFKATWDRINGAGSWSANPFVWAITFKRV